MNKTSIEWTDYTWNPVTGCHKISQGCKRCYAETMTNRFAKTWGVESFRQVVCHEDRIYEPLRKFKQIEAKKVFVCDMSDLFHDDVPFTFMDSVFDTIESCGHATFQILTKRPERALEYYRWKDAGNGLNFKHEFNGQWPLPNVWIGVSCEDQAAADQRVPVLIKIPATVRFLSCEPMLGPIDLTRIAPFKGGAINALHPHPISTPDKPFINWVICGGESGRNARPMHPDWVRSIGHQCAAAGVPFFFKQWGEWEPDIHVSFNGPFFIQEPKCKHYLVDIDGKSWPYGNGLNIRSGMKSRYTEKEDALSDECPLTKQDNAWWMANTGKSKSGNYLDGKQHLEFPKTFNPIRI